MSDDLITVYRTRSFSKLLKKHKKHKIDDSLLLEAFRLIRGGSCYSHGEDIFSQSVGHPGRGKNSGYRVFVAFRGDVAFFVTGYPRNKQDTLLPKELDTCRKTGNKMLGMDSDGLREATKDGTIVEIGVV